ncbi:DUF3817 domain-containing protein [Fictibacillus aquaticus]|uniref:DUF3817 domain-containing protein n=1 Tax=Fictibacillus aquaticus TaxID=2021314 RepID=A0A235FF19_9BACL|nr:DUF3817 domain-containing protein [Fictibacillus aquaticus]OYD59527.1 hypothetical protein CGZ90_06445 [Fictibacillus aquaticus]
MLNSPIERLRVVGNLEGLSFIVLLVIAMPLKYLADMPMAVTIVGMLHGVLFVLYIAAILHVWLVKRWPVFRVILAMAASVIPFGPFFFDAKYLKKN